MCEGEEQVFSSKLNSQGKFWKTLKKQKTYLVQRFVEVKRSVRVKKNEEQIKKKCEGEEKWRANKKEVCGWRKLKSKV